MKKVLSTAMALGFCLYLPTAVLAGGSTSNDAILRELQELRSQVSNQQAEIEKLKGKKGTSADEMEYLKNKVAANGEHIEAIEAKKGFAVSSNEFINGIKLKGDVRVRYEIDELNYKKSQDDKNREYFRTRFRLGGVWDNKAESWQVAAGLATGSDSPTSTYDTWSESKPFETGDIRLDYAYAKHKWNDFSMALGQMEIPYTWSPVFFDTDVRLAGMTLAYGQKEGVFATGGAYGAKYVNKDNTSMLYIGQAGYRGNFSEKGKFTAATGYHIYSNSIINEKSADFGLANIDPNAYELSIGDIYTDVSFPVGPVKLKMYGQLWMNFGADGAKGKSQAGTSMPGLPEDNNLGWTVGTDATIDKFIMGLSYSAIEADSLFGYLADCTYGDKTFNNRESWEAFIGYNFSKNWSTTLTYQHDERLDDWAAATEDSVNAYKLDVSYKF